MRNVLPGIEAPTLDIAKEQQEYLTVTAAMVRHPGYPFARLRMEDGSLHEFNTALLAFVPSDEERTKLAAGEPLYIGVLTGASPLQPLNIVVGAQAAADLYQTKVLE